jgi:redox-sensitive bicupin YhaK (pirin superfamily)
MTAGHGVVHAEESRGSGALHAVQLWIAQPESTRHGTPAFEHHPDLPQVRLGSATATVLVGEVDGVASPARCDSRHVGADLRADGSAVVPLDPSFEHAILVCDGSLTVDGSTVAVGQLAYLPLGRADIYITADSTSRALLLGGEPFPDELVMWWNYVARTRDEVSEAHLAWTHRDDRFGVVTSSLAAVDVAPPPWPTRL